MRKIYFIILFIVSLSACKPGVPSDIIAPSKMEDILYDIHITDGYITTLQTADTAKKVGAAYYKGIYKKFETDSVEYNRSLEYYYKNPERFNQMYLNITKRLKERQAIINAKMK